MYSSTHPVFCRKCTLKCTLHPPLTPNRTHYHWVLQAVNTCYRSVGSIAGSSLWLSFYWCEDDLQMNSKDWPDYHATGPKTWSCSGVRFSHIVLFLWLFFLSRQHSLGVLEESIPLRLCKQTASDKNQIWRIRTSYLRARPDVRTSYIHTEVRRQVVDTYCNRFWPRVFLFETLNCASVPDSLEDSD